jgi:hypothetical protein
MQWVLWAISLGVKLIGVKLTDHSLPIAESRVVEVYLYFPILLYGVVLN